MEAADYKESPSSGAVQAVATPQDSQRVPLSAVLITLNAASRLEACLASLAFADEILVVDSGSTDATVEIAQRHGARVLQQAWLGFGPQKQFAVKNAAHDWVLCLDADERVTPELRGSIAKALVHQRSSAKPAWRMARANVFMGRVLRHGEGYPDWSLRLFHRDHAHWSDDPVHESVNAAPGTPVGTLTGDLMHESSETLAIYLAKQNRYTDLQAQRLFAAGRRAGALRIAEMRAELDAKLARRQRVIAGMEQAVAAKEDRLRRLWAARLAHQMSHLPPFDDVFRAVLSALRAADLPMVDG